MTDDIEPTKTVLYCRVSSAAQVAKGHGIVSQETRCREFARMKGYEVVAVFKDEAVSGGLIDRPGMQAMLKYLRAHKRQGPAVVIIDDISRLARDLEAHLKLRTEISAAGGRLESPSIEFGEDSDSILVENLLASVSQHQRQKNAEQVLNRQRSRLLNGYWTFSCPPGYRYVRAEGQGKVLEVDETLGPIIKEALEGYAIGHFQTQAEVKRFFEGFPDFPKTRFGTVTNENVNRILTRVLYAGYLERPEWGVSLRRAKHEPLISLETYERIQERIAGKAKLPSRADLNEDFPLRGFVLCADCEQPLTACWSKSKTGAKHPYYMCFNRDCESNRKSIRKDVIEGQFAEMLAEVQPSETMAGLALTMFRHAWDQQAERARTLRASIRRRAAEIEKEIAAFLDRIVETTNRAVVARYESRIAELERERLVMAEKLQAEGPSRKRFEDMFELTLRFLANPCGVWENGSIDRRRTVLKLTFEDKLVYCREGGFRTPKTSMVFRVLGRFCDPNAGMAEGGRLPPNPLFDPFITITRVPGNSLTPGRTRCSDRRRSSAASRPRSGTGSRRRPRKRIAPATPQGADRSQPGVELRFRVRLSSHKGPRSRAMIEAAGASMLFLPAYTVDALWAAIGRIADAFTPAECLTTSAPVDTIWTNGNPL